MEREAQTTIPLDKGNQGAAGRKKKKRYTSTHATSHSRAKKHKTKTKTKQGKDPTANTRPCGDCLRPFLPLLQLCATHGAAAATMKPTLDARLMEYVSAGRQHHHGDGAVRGGTAAGLGAALADEAAARVPVDRRVAILHCVLVVRDGLQAHEARGRRHVASAKRGGLHPATAATAAGGGGAGGCSCGCGCGGSGVTSREGGVRGRTHGQVVCTAIARCRRCRRSRD